MKVREDIEANETEKEVFHDIVITVYNRLHGMYHGWPPPMHIILLLKNKILGHSVSKQEFVAHGVPLRAARAFVERYFRQRCLRGEIVNKYDMSYI